MPAHKKHFNSKSTPNEAPAPGVPIPQKEFDRLKKEARTKKLKKGCPACEDPSKGKP